MKFIKLTQNKHAIIDDGDYEFLTEFNWYALRIGNIYYAKTSTSCNGKRIFIYMHQMVIDRMFGYKENGLVPDHIDRNGLNNQRNNLRLVTQTVNLHNRAGYGKSKFKGVCWSKKANKWQANITSKKKTYHIGYFTDEVEAAKAYDGVAIKIYGSDTTLNIY